MSSERSVKDLSGLYTGFMERAMGIEPTSEIWDAISLLGFFFRCVESSRQVATKTIRNGRTRIIQLWRQHIAG
jgi:hypothetical protein